VQTLNAFHWARQAPKLPLSLRIWTPSNTWFFGPWATQVTYPNSLPLCSYVSKIQVPWFNHVQCPLNVISEYELVHPSKTDTTRRQKEAMNIHIISMPQTNNLSHVAQPTDETLEARLQVWWCYHIAGNQTPQECWVFDTRILQDRHTLIYHGYCHSKKGKGFPYLLPTEHWAQSWSRYTGSQPTGDYKSSTWLLTCHYFPPVLQLPA